MHVRYTTENTPCCKSEFKEMAPLTLETLCIL